MPGAGSQLDGVRVLDDDRPALGRDRSSRLAGLLGPFPAPPPDPAADYYARYMHAAKDRADALAKRSADSSGRVPDDDETPADQPDDERLASRSRDAAGSSPRRTTDPVRDEAIQVTLLPPEPLPALAGTQDADLAWTTSQAPGQRREEQPPVEADPAPAPRRAASARGSPR